MLKVPILIDLQLGDIGDVCLLFFEVMHYFLIMSERIVNIP